MPSLVPRRKACMRFSNLVLITFFLTISSFSWANTPVSFAFISEDGRYNFDGSFTIKADMDVVWDVLTDYNHVSNFISNMHSKVKKRDGNDLEVEQDAGGGFLFIQEHLKALLDIHEEPQQSISFNDVSHKAFELYSGVWHLQADPATGEVKVIYDLQATRSKGTPDFLTSDLFSGSLGDLLNETQREIAKRQVRKDKSVLEAAKRLATAVPTALVTPSPTMLITIVPTPTGSNDHASDN
jgi:hypothetical protein